MANSTSQDDAGPEYYPIHIARSDGRGYMNLDHNALNPKEDQDVQQLERWEVILAGHLQYQLAPKEDKKQYKLAAFPKGYELRCAIRKDGGRDYYTYGHPAGPKSSYRTPGDFVLHILWLASDSTDYSQCSCDLCTKMVEANKQRQPTNSGLDPSMAANAPVQPVTNTMAPPRPGPVNPEPQPQPQPQPQLQSQAQAQSQSLPLAQPQAQAQTQARPQPQTQPQPKPQPQTQPQPQTRLQPQSLSQSQSQPQNVQTAPSGTPPGTTGLSNIFRVGEVVWYKHTAWRLGLILGMNCKSSGYGGDDTQYRFILAPLGHAMLNQQNVTKDAQDMRPFLTFSVPNVAIDELQDKGFHEVDWQAFATRYSEGLDVDQRAMRMQMVGLEASKMAARHVNDSFSTFDKMAQAPTADGSFLIQTYAGVYFGAEMVRIGDLIRVTAPSSAADNHPDATAVMHVDEIQVATATSGAANTLPNLQFKGHLYRTIRSTLPFPPGVVPVETSEAAFVEEVGIRNQIEHDKKWKWGWLLVQRDAVRMVADVQGRFYVTHKLMNIIDRDSFQESMKNGVVESAQSYLNNRSHSGRGLYIERKPSRGATLGLAVRSPFTAPQGMVED
ncbi:transcription-silencing protein Clr2-domain-containing protein [Podospora appendiculata]|uniref:Transcription-silencing protein Clr2-domain-containing protein n=1 Tax=Podospora appendiculata TaxID=314037 RepID=A0AAE0X9D2_9PEZI|nr:transcription-silencing protein Clr2-domain-containing protein [Podospora appendiculata]